MRSNLLLSFIRFFTVLFCLSLSKPSQILIPFGEFKGSKGYESFNLKLKKNNTFEQISQGCTWAFFAKGRWYTKNDTIFLHEIKLYRLKNNRRIFMQKGKRIGNEFYMFKNIVILNKDTLKQLYYGKNGKFYKSVQLKRRLNK